MDHDPSTALAQDSNDIPSIGDWWKQLAKWKQVMFAILCLTKPTEQIAICTWYGYSKNRRKNQSL